MKIFITIAFFCLITRQGAAQSIVAPKPGAGTFSLDKAVIYTDTADFAVVKKSAALLVEDIHRVTGITLKVIYQLPAAAECVIIIGSAERSRGIKQLINDKKINNDSINNKWEAWQLQTVKDPFTGCRNALVITGSDRRGVAYGVFELSRQIGVSPWYWWADVSDKKSQSIILKENLLLHDAPKVKYRGIFINDEAPALSNWSREKFGGFNHRFYEKVFELMLRLRANYIWPAMWGNAFYDDDSLNIRSAEEFAIVIGTSHHEPLMRAHAEWRKYGSGKWNYDSNEAKLQEFWKGGMRRATNEKIVTVGMRGDGDEPMSRETATTLLETIVNEQRSIITEVTGKPAEQTPQLWALYKEVQDYYDKGMRVPDDITLLLCDDNWGNLRKLPRLGEKQRKGGYGIYYHFDYVGGPRNYKWVNTNPLPRIWEQMHLAWEYNAREIWIVNVGDIKPMEFPITFFLDYAWNPERIDAGDLQKYTENWCAVQFGQRHAKEIAAILSAYGKYNSRRKPELLDGSTYSFNYDEWKTVVDEYKSILKKAEDIKRQLPVSLHDAYFQLILHPVKACSNLYELYYNTALNNLAYQNKWSEANVFADKVKYHFLQDSLITKEYHLLNSGKWNHMMAQTHIGYTYWQQPPAQKMPAVNYVPVDSVIVKKNNGVVTAPGARNTPATSSNSFYEVDKYVSIAADHFTRALKANGINWKVLPDHGRTGSALTTVPVTATTQTADNNGPHVEYEVYTSSKGEFDIKAYFSPSLNFNSAVEGLQYAISVDNEIPQIISLNKEDKNSITGIWNKWVAENIIIKTSKHSIEKPGKHVVKYWMITPGVVLQKLVLDFGGVKPSYLGPPETINKKKN